MSSILSGADVLSDGTWHPMVNPAALARGGVAGMMFTVAALLWWMLIAIAREKPSVGSLCKR